MSRAAKSQFRYNKMQVLYLTGISDEQYNNFQIDMAKAWVEFYWQNIIDTKVLLNTTIFWRWWVLQWNGIDDRSILQTLYTTPPAQRHTKYRELHQYVFDADNLLQQYMTKDFRSMRS